VGFVAFYSGSFFGSVRLQKLVFFGWVQLHQPWR